MIDNVDIPAERLKKVLSYLKKNGSGKIKDLSILFGVSSATIRRDFDILAVEGVVEKTYGGAIYIHKSLSYERLYSEKIKFHEKEKLSISECCANIIQDGDTVFLDSGTTTFHIGKALSRKRNLTIFTHDLAIASMINFDATTQVIVAGGEKREGHYALVGSTTENFIDKIRIDYLFLSADAVDIDFGVSDSIMSEASIKSRLCDAAKTIILVADSTKYGRVAVQHVCDLTQIHIAITDKHIPRILEKKFAEKIMDFRIV